MNDDVRRKPQASNYMNYFLRRRMYANPPRPRSAVDDGSGTTVKVMASMPMLPDVASRVNWVLALMTSGVVKS